jgi:histidine triad (HIT) family protein
MSDTCLFCKIVAGEIPGEIVFQDENTIAFLDIGPLFPGHVLLAPKQHFQTLTDLPSDLVPVLFLNAQTVTRAVETAMEAQGSFIGINNRVSQSVPHLHVHIVPRTAKDGLKGFFWPRKPYADSDHLKETANKIRQALAATV